MEAWLAPALIAAIVSGLVNVVGWFVTFRIGLQRDRMLRQEKVRDFQVALRAEIRSHRKALELFGPPDQPDQSLVTGETVPFVPRKPNPFLFNAIVDQIHVLPGEVIDPVVLYYGQYALIQSFSAEIRTAEFAALESPRRSAMFLDYIEIGRQAVVFADEAISALDEAIDAEVQ